MSKSQAKLNLPDLLRMKSYRHALIATFAFSPRFFEEIALERFRVFKDNGNISVVIDRTVYEDLIARDPENRENFPKKANIRYLLHPISTPGNFHAKIFLFANKDRGLLIIGSANLTRDGLSSNAELCAVFEFDKEENTGFHRLFQDVIGYFWKLQEYAPSNEFESNLRELEFWAHLLGLLHAGPNVSSALRPALASELRQASECESRLEG